MKIIWLQFAVLSVCLKEGLVQYFIVTVLLHSGELLLDRLKAETELSKRDADVQRSCGDLKCCIIVTSRQQPGYKVEKVKPSKSIKQLNPLHLALQACILTNYIVFITVLLHWKNTPHQINLRGCDMINSSAIQYLDFFFCEIFDDYPSK